MLNPKAFANAATAVEVVVALVCVGLSYIAPDFLLGIATSWVHTLNLQAIKATEPLTGGVVVYGLVTSAVLTWIVTYAFAALYNRWK